jgi:uncharacterized membrane protein
MQSELVPTSGNGFIDYLESRTIEPMDLELAREGTRIAVAANTILFFGAVVLVPFTLFGTSYVYSKAVVTGWVVVSLICIGKSVMIWIVYLVVMYKVDRAPSCISPSLRARQSRR